MAKAGEGQVVLLSGEAGIGKSRLTAAILEWLNDEPHTRVRYFCSPQHTASAFYPIMAQMKRAAGFSDGDTLQAKLDKLDAMLVPTLTRQEDAALFAEMLSLPNDGRYPVLDLAPQQRRQRTFEALTTQIEALTRQNPVLMIFEDVHWADPTSLEALGRAVDRIKNLGMLLIVTYRPEFKPPWGEHPHVVALGINRLGNSDVANIINAVTGDKQLPENIKQIIIERTDGIPLFAEEMTKAVLEGSDSAEDNNRAFTSPVLAVPPTLHALLMARLDRLGWAKEIAQIGAVIGREFSHRMLVLVARTQESTLNAALGRLVRADLLFQQGRPPDTILPVLNTTLQDAPHMARCCEKFAPITACPRCRNSIKPLCPEHGVLTLRC